jgi:hypothetical protein
LRTPSKRSDNRYVRLHNCRYGYIRLHYCRYAEDYIIGILGSATLTKKIKEEVTEFLKGIGIKLNEDKTFITNFQRQPINFLGFKILGSNKINIEKPIKNKIVSKIGNVRRIKTRTRLSFRLDYDKILN